MFFNDYISIVQANPFLGKCWRFKDSYQQFLILKKSFWIHGFIEIVEFLMAPNSLSCFNNDLW